MAKPVELLADLWHRYKYAIAKFDNPEKPRNVVIYFFNDELENAKEAIVIDAKRTLYKLMRVNKSWKILSRHKLDFTDLKQYLNELLAEMRERFINFKVH